MRFRNCLLVSIVILCFPNNSIGNGNQKDTVTFCEEPFPEFPDSGDSFVDEFQWFIESGKLSSARRKALEELQNPSPNRWEKSDIARVYTETFRKSYDAGGDNYLQKIQNAADQPTVRAKNDSLNCVKTHSDWTVVDPYELWDESCSILPRQDTELSLDLPFPSLSQQNSFLGSSFQEQCCVFTQGSWTYLRLPAIFEPAIKVGIRQNYKSDTGPLSKNNSSITFLNIEQDGYLRPYNVAGILWPTGYMLSLCLGNLVGCPIPELQSLIKNYQENFISKGPSGQDEAYRNHRALALELGTGVGASSIALAKSLQTLGFPSSSSHEPNGLPWVVATDIAPHALALTMANANSNDVYLDTAIMDHFNQSSVKEVKQRFFPRKRECFEGKNQRQHFCDGFSLIFGSSLQGLFRDTDRLDSPLWKTIGQLLDSNNPYSMVILVHNREDLQNVPSDVPYQLIRQFWATDPFFGNMMNRAGDPEGDFVLSVLKPKMHMGNTVDIH